MSRVLLYLSENNPDETIDLDEASKYINIRIVNIFKTYDDGEEIVRKVYYPLVECSNTYI